MLVKHLLSRNFNPDLYKNIVLDHQNQILTVYLHNLSGQLIGYQQYNPNSIDKVTRIKDKARYFSHKTEGTLALWGFENLNPKITDCFIVEGIFKASVLHMLGLNAISVLGSSPKSALQQLQILPYRLIAIGDNDNAGKKLIDTIGLGTRFEKDVDEYSLEEVAKLIERLLWEI